MSTYQDEQTKLMSDIFFQIQELTMNHKSMESCLKEMIYGDQINNFDCLEESSRSSIEICNKLRKLVEHFNSCQRQ